MPRGATAFSKTARPSPRLMSPARTHTYAFGINDAGQIVGSSMMPRDGTAFSKTARPSPRLMSPARLSPKPSGSTTLARSWGTSVMPPGDYPRLCRDTGSRTCSRTRNLATVRLGPGGTIVVAQARSCVKEYCPAAEISRLQIPVWVVHEALAEVAANLVEVVVWIEVTHRTEWHFE